MQNYHFFISLKFIPLATVPNKMLYYSITACILEDPLGSLFFNTLSGLKTLLVLKYM